MGTLSPSPSPFDNSTAREKDHSACRRGGGYDSRVPDMLSPSRTCHTTRNTTLPRDHAERREVTTAFAQAARPPPLGDAVNADDGALDACVNAGGSALEKVRWSRDDLGVVHRALGDDRLLVQYFVHRCCAGEQRLVALASPLRQLHLLCQLDLRARGVDTPLFSPQSREYRTQPRNGTELTN